MAKNDGCIGQSETDEEALLRFVRALARADARRDHALALELRTNPAAGKDLREIFNRPPEREVYGSKRGSAK